MKRTLSTRLRLAFGSVQTRLTFSYILVAVLTTLMGFILLLVLVIAENNEESSQDYAYFAANAVMLWQLDTTQVENYEYSEDMAAGQGYSLVVSSQNNVLYATNDAPCRVGQPLTVCAPELMNLPVGHRFVVENGKRLAEAVITTTTGERAITRQTPFSLDELVNWSSPLLFDLRVPGILAAIFGTSLTVGIFSIPVALLLVWLTGRPLARRLGRIALASKQFAHGELDVRLQDRNMDEVGQVARQFNDMADALQQNMRVLRDLAQQNSELAERAESVAIHAERMRLSRDLHDAIAQRLFSLTVSTSSLPSIVERDQAAGVHQAQVIAQLAEQTLIDLRALLVDLRPAPIIQQGLTHAIRTLCEQWEQLHQIPIDLQIVLRSVRIPNSVETTLYYITQEALSNIAKHADAKAVSISLLEGQTAVVLSVTDNGKGFGTAAVQNNGHHLGLISMRERSEMIGGELFVESDTHHGCTIRLNIPLQLKSIVG